MHLEKVQKEMWDHMDFAKYFASHIQAVDSALHQAVPALDARATVLQEAMHYALFPGGKRVRPLIVLCVAEALGGSQREALPSAVALELLHNYTLIHDDLPCMDNDMYRRGKPTCHVRFGEATALLAGDALLTLAFEQASCSVHAPAAVVRLLSEVGGGHGVIGGQVADLAAMSSEEVSEDDITFIHQNKTAALFRAAAMLGGYAAGKEACADDMAALSCFGQSLGMAFQYVDDLLDDGDDSAFSSVGVLGLSRVKALANSYTTQALESLEALDADWGALRSLAGFMLKREV
jgi:geranylgeranyl diphosphate synthase type II